MLKPGSLFGNTHPVLAYCLRYVILKLPNVDTNGLVNIPQGVAHFWSRLGSLIPLLSVWIRSE